MFDPDSAAEIETAISNAEADDFDWMLIEIFGHRTVAGRGREEERFGGKMLRIDIPRVEWSEPSAEQPEPKPIISGWVTQFYGGGAIFSQTFTDEATVLRRNARYSRPARYLPSPDAAGSPEPISGDTFIDGEGQLADDEDDY